MPAGRPSPHPEGTTSSERNRLALARLEAAGARRVNILLPPDAASALDARKRPGETDKAALLRLLTERDPGTTVDPDLEALCGVLEGADREGFRDREDRY